MVARWAGCKFIKGWHWLRCRNGEPPPGRGQADSDLLRGLHLLHRSVATYVASKLGPTNTSLPEDLSPIAALAGEPGSAGPKTHLHVHLPQRWPHFKKPLPARSVWPVQSVGWLSAGLVATLLRDKGSSKRSNLPPGHMSMSASLSDITAFSGQGFLMEASAMLNGEALHAVLLFVEKQAARATPVLLTPGGSSPHNAERLLLLVQVALMLTMWTSGTSSSCRQPGRWGSPPAAGSKSSSTCRHLPASLTL